MLLLSLHILVSAAFGQGLCLQSDPTSTEQELSRQCQLNLCTRELEIPQTTEDLARLRAQHGLPAFSPLTSNELNSARAARQLLRGVSARQLVDDFLNGSDTQNAALLEYTNSIFLDNGEELVINSSAGLTESMGVELRRFHDNLRTSETFQYLINYDSEGSFLDGYSDEELAKFESFFNVTLDVNSTGPNLADLEFARNFFREGRRTNSTNKRHRLARIVGQILKKQINDQHATFVEIAQRSIDMLQESLDTAVSEGSLLCDLSDYYSRRAQAVAGEGILQTWQNQARAGFTEGVLTGLPQNIREHILTESQRCSVEVQIPSVNEVVSRGGFREENRYATTPVVEAQIAIGNIEACRALTLPTDSISVSTEGEGTISLSTSTLVYGGADVYYHELGHCYSRILRRTTFDPETASELSAFRSCLSSMHGGSEQYIEEDFADWVSARISPRSDGLGCHLLELISGQPGMAVNDSLYDSNPLDNHSNALFRALHVRMVQGQEVHSSCRELMSQKDERPVACGL